MAEKTRISPAICAMPDERHENLHIEVELPGVEKKDISLSMHEDSFFIQASRDDLEFVGSYAVCCPIDTEKAKAKYNNGLLSIDVPYLKPQERAEKIPVQ
jgi:HSP20 family molecular chaperone IbpA